jgi:hypothetical protein
VEFDDINIGGTEYHFTGKWRIPREGHLLPAVKKDRQGYEYQDVIPAEMIFIDTNGTEIGLHPQRAMELVGLTFEPLEKLEERQGKHDVRRERRRNNKAKSGRR